MFNAYRRWEFENKIKKTNNNKITEEGINRILYQTGVSEGKTLEEKIKNLIPFEHEQFYRKFYK